VAQEVDVFDPDPERLALSQAAAGRQQRERTPPIGVCGDHGSDPAGCPGDDALLSTAGALTAFEAQGLRAMTPSSTAAPRIDDRFARMTRT
jgi:hypothetical protein